MNERDRRQRPKLKPLRITCTSSDCDNNLHCFKKSREMAESDRGQCRSCGADLINWDRVHRRDIKDADFVFNGLKFELFRHKYWHKEIDIRTENHARRKGRIVLKNDVKKRLQNYIAPINNPYDGRQTPLDGNIIYYAQHALACCCRKCLEYWHGISTSIPLSDSQINYFVNLIMMYIDERMSSLTEKGEIIPPIRHHQNE